MLTIAHSNGKSAARKLAEYAGATGKTVGEANRRVARQSHFLCSLSENRGGVKRARLGKFPLNAASDPRKKGRTFKKKFYFALLTKRGVSKKGQGLKDAARAEYGSRRSSKGANALGMRAVAEALGLKGRGVRGAD